MITNADIYNETTLVNDIKKDYCSDAPEDALLLSMFGYFGELEARNLRNSIITQSELSNEVFYTRCKKDNNIILHSVSNGVTDINAIPASMSIMLGIKESDINSMLISNVATLYTDCKLFIEDFEFHFDYNILINKSTIENGEIIYTARYDIGNNSGISDITNPYLQAPVIISINKENYIFIYCSIRQVTYTTIDSKIISNSSLENKMLDFEFEDQLATFYVNVTEDGVTTTLRPILEGLNLNNYTNYCKYSYIDNNTIRVIFDPNSYTPGLNADVSIVSITTKGAEGNFEYNSDLIVTLDSDTGNYKNISSILKIQSTSKGGKDRKNATELQSILPKEALSKGTISIYKGLENAFNSFNTSDFRIKIEPRADNNAMRTYFTYITMKDTRGNVVPTNTITANIKETEFGSVTNNIYVIPQSSYVLLNTGDSVANIKINPTTEEITAASFIYTIPFMTVINYERSYIGYYSTLIDQQKMIYFRDINRMSELQFIATTGNWKREYLTDKNTYKFTFNLSQNVSYEYGLIEEITNSDTGVITYNSKLRIIAIMYNDDGEAYRYSEATLLSYDNTLFNYSFKLEFITDDSIDSTNNIKITNVKEIGTETEAYGFLPSNTNIDLYVLIETNDVQLGRYELDSYVPNLENYSVSNVYQINDGIDFFVNYSESINSVLTFSQDTSGVNPVEVFTLKSLPVVKRDYVMRGEEYIQYFMRSIAEKKEFIDDTRYVLDNNFNIDMKFFNTYGPSKRFVVDSNNGIYLDKVNIIPKFRIQTLENTDGSVISKIKKEIKDLVEDITPYTLPSIHFVRIAGIVYNKYKDSVDYIQCIGINDYSSDIQYLERTSTNNILDVPELITIDEDDNGNPNIIIF